MGQANNNPRSPQFRGKLPDFHIEPRTEHGLFATPEWMEANKEALAGSDPPKPKPEDCGVRVQVILQMVYPSGLVGIEHWRGGAVTIGVLELPFTQLKEAVDTQIAARDQPPVDGASVIVLPPELPPG